MTYEQQLTQTYAAVRNRLRMNVKPVNVRAPVRTEPPAITGPKLMKSQGRATWVQILNEVAIKHNIDAERIAGSRGTPDVSLARQEAFWRMSRAGMSYSEIGLKMNRDRSTVLYGVEQHQDRIAG